MNDLTALRRKLERDGFAVRKSRHGHWKVHDSRGRLIAVTGSTPSDRRSLRNFRGALRRAGAVR